MHLIQALFVINICMYICVYMHDFTHTKICTYAVLISWKHTGKYLIILWVTTFLLKYVKPGTKKAAMGYK